MSQLLIICGIFAIVVFTSTAAGHRTNQKIYINIDGMSACFRRMNATHQVGCASQRGGNVGVVHHVRSETQIDWIRDKGPHAPYAILLPAKMFNEKIMKALMDTGKINSVLVISTESTWPPAFSADLTCPNDQYGIYHGDSEYGGCKKIQWNPDGTGFMFRDFPFPIVALTNQTEIDILITKCYKRFNAPCSRGFPRTYPLCSAQVKDEMDAIKDTPTCVRRSQLLQGLNPETYCDPLGGYSVFSYTRPITFDRRTKNDSVIIASARLDGFSMFENRYVNADSTVSGIVALLGAAYAIGKRMMPGHHRPIMFTFFNGEAYDYIGSSRMVYDMEKMMFPTTEQKRGRIDSVSPLSFHQLHSFLEVSQVGIPVGQKMWLHQDPRSAGVTKNRVDEMVSAMKKAGREAGLDVDRAQPAGQPLPPASLHTFLRKLNISGLLFADHQQEFENKFYNSQFDTSHTLRAEYPENIPQNETYNYVTEGAIHLAKVASTIAKALYILSTGDLDTSDISVDNITMANLLNCYLHRGDCELFYQVAPLGTVLREKPYTYYVEVSNSYRGPQNVSHFTHRILAYFLGTKFITTKGNCSVLGENDLTQVYTWMAGPVDSKTGLRAGLCIRSSANVTLARSPAFDIDGYDWSSARYSSWSESQWQTDAMKLRIFLVPSPEREIHILVGGLSFAVLSTGLVYIIKRRSRSLFTLSS